MVPSNSDRKLALARMSANNACYRLRNARNETRVFEDADRRVGRSGDLLELVVTIEVDIPAEFLELVNKPCVYEVDGTLIDTWLGL